MENYLTLLSRSELFAGIRREEQEKLLLCLNARQETFRRHEIIRLAGQPVKDIGIVLEGRVRVIREDFMGNRNILTELAPGRLFMESYACLHTEASPVSVVAATDCAVLWVDCRCVIGPCIKECPYHCRLVRNMIGILAARNIRLSRKIEHVSKRTTREKLLAYLTDEAVRHGAREFVIPFNRQELADYLCVDRSALSAELGRMQREGVLQFSRSHFILCRPAPRGQKKGGPPDKPVIRP